MRYYVRYMSAILPKTLNSIRPKMVEFEKFYCLKWYGPFYSCFKVHNRLFNSVGYGKKDIAEYHGIAIEIKLSQSDGCGNVG